MKIYDLTSATHLDSILRHPKTWSIIDVRSPGEYALDHIPQSLNLPVLDNSARHHVGKEYVQGSKLEARRLGAATISREIAHHLETHPLFESPAPKWLLACARGGLRSSSFAFVLKQIGYDVSILEGGHKAFRQHVRQQLSETPALPKIVIHGPSGTGKTRCLQKLSKEQLKWCFIDLEDCAQHRGSRFGNLGLNPRKQRSFENYLWYSLIQVSSNTAGLLIEGESLHLGHCYIPKAFFQWMTDGPHIWIELPLEVRVQNIIKDYLHEKLSEESINDLRKLLPTLKGHLSNQNIQHLEKLLNDRHFFEFVHLLLDKYFDPHYRRHHQKMSHQMIQISAHDNDDLDKQLSELLKAHSIIQQPHHIQAYQ